MGFFRASRSAPLFKSATAPAVGHESAHFLPEQPRSGVPQSIVAAPAFAGMVHFLETSRHDTMNATLAWNRQIEAVRHRKAPFFTPLFCRASADLSSP